MSQVLKSYERTENVNRDSASLESFHKHFITRLHRLHPLFHNHKEYCSRIIMILTELKCPHE